MEFGVVLPQLGATWDQTLDAARKAEAGGFDSVWVVDHTYGIPPQTGILEAWTVMAALAAATTRVGIGAQVLCQSFRNPALLAKMSTTFDLVSGGRLRFLIGAGWYDAEYRAFGYDFPPPGVRVGQLEDTVHICKGMWAAGKEPFTYHGRHYRVDEVLNLPPQPRPIPIGIGGQGDRVLDLTAREADEWNCPGAVFNMFAERNALLEERLAKYGRTVRRSVQSVLRPGDGDFPGRLQFFNPQLGIHGSPDRMAQRACELRDMGIDGFYAIVAGEKGLEGAVEALPGIRAALGP
jgi:alkanesulfonate monooxygenase SsuD/methylene tetrahydromethanopterin reductase-like flavin-dependent oxidoreductase (luciferase family)